jgi:hypothetical protein
MKKISVWYDKKAGLLEVLFEKKIGYFRVTKNEAIMERVDQNGNVIGFMVEVGLLKTKEDISIDLGGSNYNERRTARKIISKIPKAV